MNKLFVVVLLASLALPGCLQEKQLGQNAQALPTTTVATATSSTTTSTPTQTPTSAPTAAATAAATATPTPAPTAALQAGSCSVISSGNKDTYARGSTVTYFVTFTGLSSSVITASVKCDTGEDAINMDINTDSSGKRFLRRDCSYSPSSTRSYTFSATAGGAACNRIITVTS